MGSVTPSSGEAFYVVLAEHDVGIDNVARTLMKAGVRGIVFETAVLQRDTFTLAGDIVFMEAEGRMLSNDYVGAYGLFGSDQYGRRVTVLGHEEAFAEAVGKGDPLPGLPRDQKQGKGDE